jgi:NADH-quinone oxidoreductase subunit M
MSEFHLPWIEWAILIPLVGAAWVSRLRDPDVARRHSLVACGLTLVCALASWFEFNASPAAEACDYWDPMLLWSGTPAFTIDALNAPLIPLAALLYALTVLATLRTKVRRVPFAWLLISEAILLATFSTKQTWLMTGLLALGTIPPFVELRSHGKPTRVYALHMGLFVVLLVGGQAMLAFEPSIEHGAIIGVAMLMAAVLIRSGIVPVHCWMTDLFEHATLGMALLFVTPMVGAYAAVRLVLPIAPNWTLEWISLLSLVTALYAAGMSLVQREARRFFCYLFLSHSSLVLVGLETATAMSLTGALYVWLSVSLSLTGFGLMLRSIESRTGRLSLDVYHGLYEHTPRLAALFLLTGLASIGFPGTVGFVGSDLLVEGAVMDNPMIGFAVVITAALNSLAVLHAYFHIFTGTRRTSSIDLRIRMPEQVAALILAALIIGFGLYPQPGVNSRHEAAEHLVEQRDARFGPEPQVDDDLLFDLSGQ